MQVESFSGVDANFFEGLAAFTAIAFMCMASAYNDPALLIGAIGGSGSVMLTHASMNSARYRDLQTDFHHHTYEWSRFTEVAIDRKQKLVGLEFAWYNDYLNKHSRSTFPLLPSVKRSSRSWGLLSSTSRMYLGPTGTLTVVNAHWAEGDG